MTSCARFALVALLAFSPRASLAQVAASVKAPSTPGIFGFAFHVKQPPPNMLLGVCGVAPSSPAARAGLRLNDGITALDGRADFRNAFEALSYIYARSAGEPLRLRVLHNGRSRTIEITAQPASPQQIEAKRQSLALAQQEANAHTDPRQ